MEARIRDTGRRPRMRTTLYADALPERRKVALQAAPLAEVHSATAGKQQRSKRLSLPGEAKAASDVVALNWVRQNRDAVVYESVVLMAACN
jgi:hypothetical protein